LETGQGRLDPPYLKEKEKAANRKSRRGSTLVLFIQSVPAIAA
jgi:hypothetical protein